MDKAVIHKLGGGFRVMGVMSTLVCVDHKWSGDADGKLQAL